MTNFDLLVKRVLTPFKFKLLKKSLKKKRKIKLLDVGCGAKASEIAKFSLNLLTYDGVDNQVWQGDQSSYEDIDSLYDIDVEKQNIDVIPDDHYDVIIVSHLIEHIQNGEELIERLCSKLCVNGVIYIETPSPKTLNLPSAIGFANFYDDPTHIRMYFDHAIINVLMKQDMEIIGYGIRRDILRITILSPIMLLLNFIYFLPIKRKLNAKGLWDALGVAQYWCARRVK